LSSNPSAPKPAAPTLAQQGRIWLRIGLASWGGGQGTRLNIYRAFVETGDWMTPLEFAEAWAVCQLGPGMSLVALAALIGYRFSRAAGAAAALVGLLLPSALITILITISYQRLRNFPVTRAALRGVVAAVIGLAFANVIFNARPLLAASLRKSRPTLGIATLLILVDAVLFAFWHFPVVLLLIPSALFFAAWSSLGTRLGRLV
jgi:chromate transporter